MTAGQRTMEIVLRASVAVLTLATAWIHFSLGGLLFLMNAAGYTVFAGALVAPIALAGRFRWLVRLGLLGFTMATIAGWVVMGARFPLAYVDKGIELVLVALLAADIRRADGGPADAIRRLMVAFSALVGPRLATGHTGAEHR